MLGLHLGLHPVSQLVFICHFILNFLNGKLQKGEKDFMKRQAAVGGLLLLFLSLDLCKLQCSIFAIEATHSIHF